MIGLLGAMRPRPAPAPTPGTPPVIAAARVTWTAPCPCGQARHLDVRTHRRTAAHHHHLQLQGERVTAYVRCTHTQNSSSGWGLTLAELRRFVEEATHLGVDDTAIICDGAGKGLNFVTTQSEYDAAEARRGSRRT